MISSTCVLDSFCVLIMRRSRYEPSSTRRTNLWYIMLGIGAIYLFIIVLQYPDLFENVTAIDSSQSNSGAKHSLGNADDDDNGRTSNNAKGLHIKLQKRLSENVLSMPSESERREAHNVVHQYGRVKASSLERLSRMKNFTILENMADDAWSLGLKEWAELEKFDETKIEIDVVEEKPELCPPSISETGEQLDTDHQLMSLPCGLFGGSSITIVGTPRSAHQVHARTRNGTEIVMVSSFVVELQGLKAVSGEDPPKILHLNPRLRGDFSKHPVIEHNTCYRMQWGVPQRCDGFPSKNTEDMLVDGSLRCEKWMRNAFGSSADSKILSWFQRFIDSPNKPKLTWPFPFVEGRLFILTIRAGVDGYHISVGGRHVTSFPYRSSFALEDATGLLVRGDVDVHSVYGTSLPTTHPSFSPQGVIDFSEKWKSNPLPNRHIKMFVGVLSATNHFAERMAVRRTWMQSLAVKSSDVVVRFFVALNPTREVNAVLKKEAAYFGDIVIVPFMDRYELVVLKTIAICEYGVQNMETDYVMKCDDDNFVRVDHVLQKVEHVSNGSALYMGNFNLMHRPLRHGKWAVSFEEWPEEIYPPYANGPGYIISMDIAKYIVTRHQDHSLQLFKMEDVSMGMWAQQFNNSITPVQYDHSLKFCQFGCVANYFTAHYQSPRQMDCLWNNLVSGRVRCCS